MTIVHNVFNIVSLFLLYLVAGLIVSGLIFSGLMYILDKLFERFDK